MVKACSYINFISFGGKLFVKHREKVVLGGVQYLSAHYRPTKNTPENGVDSRILISQGRDA
jgi:hypothetical protein